MIRIVHPGSGFFTHPGVKKAQVPGSATLIKTVSMSDNCKQVGSRVIICPILLFVHNKTKKVSTKWHNWSETEKLCLINQFLSHVIQSKPCPLSKIIETVRKILQRFSSSAQNYVPRKPCLWSRCPSFVSCSRWWARPWPGVWTPRVLPTMPRPFLQSVTEGRCLLGS